MAKRLRHYLNRFGILTLILVVAVALYMLGRAGDISAHDHTSEVQKSFTKREHELVKFTQAAAHHLKTRGFESLHREFTSGSPFYIHVFRNDTLVYWNTNKMPIYSLADLHFPSEGLFNLQNGWYFSDMVKAGRYKIIGSFLLQHIYPYENERLHNHFNHDLAHVEGIILPDKIPGKNIYCRHEKPLFSFQETIDPESQNTNQTLIFGGILLLILLVWAQLNTWFTGRYAPLILAAAAVVLRIISLQFNLFESLHQSSLFDPTILALSETTPNLGELLLSFLVFLGVMNSVVRFMRLTRKSSLPNRIITMAGLLALPVLGSWMSYMGQMIVENSSIPLQLDQIFTLDRFSIVILILIGVSGFTYVIYVTTLMTAFLRSGWSLRTLVFTWLVLSAILLISTAFLHSLIFSATLWTVILSGTILYVIWRFRGKWNFSFILLELFLFSIATTLNINQFAAEKEMEERELYANQLSDEQDPNTEIEFLSARTKLYEEPYMQRFNHKESLPQASELKEALERRVFNGYWERYDIDFFYFDRKDTLTRFNGKKLTHFRTLINRHGEQSEVDSNLFFVKDYTSQYAYIFRLELISDSSDILFFGTLKSKKVPEEIGFPRLLISNKAKVFESLGNYSIAKYYAGKLVFKYGDYSYPVEAGAFPEMNSKVEKRFFDKDGYNHLFLRKTDRDFIILSRQNIGWLEGITAVAFLFVTFGALLAAFLLFESRAAFMRFKGLSLAVKIQVVLVGLVFVSLLSFGIGSGTFVRTQYEEYTSDLIREKLHSISVVSRLRLGDLTSIEKVRENIDLEYHLRNWSSIFVTDINIYDLRGQLIGSSRPKIYNIGLLSEQMNPDALSAMVHSKKSEFIHQESIGTLDYLSAYTPYYNNDGNLIAYINLQHFDQQNEFESQIQRFLVAIINVFMLLLALSIIGAVFISSWLTSPLRMIQRSFSRMEFGKSNQPIEYNSKDEIGDLVREYNQKLAELDLAAQSLAQSERESAWREMAKQVAHEIKNPLTPMKLSIQQLLRVYDPNDPDSRRKIERVSQSVIEQIDALTNIANAFSNFAKMPQPSMETIELRSFLESAVAVYNLDDRCSIELLVNADVFIRGDKEMLLRVMNNLLTNAKQAIPADRDGKIKVELSSNGISAIITVSDNGSGIPEGKLSTVFEPYFTTKSTGTGLGLAMVRQITEGHGGSVSVSETSAEGTTIELVLPLA